MYVRTKEGKIFNCFAGESMGKPVYYIKGSLTNGFIDYNEAYKVSPNIIDIVQVGDYVNGCMVINKKDDTIQIIQLIIPFDLKELEKYGFKYGVIIDGNKGYYKKVYAENVGSSIVEYCVFEERDFFGIRAITIDITDNFETQLDDTLYNLIKDGLVEVE